MQQTTNMQVNWSNIFSPLPSEEALLLLDENLKQSSTVFQNTHFKLCFHHELLIHVSLLINIFPTT